MREINLVVIHCTDSDFPQHDNITTVREWHVDQNGWSDIGYHYFINKMGKLHIARRIGNPGAHVRGKNSHSIGIAVSGKQQFTEMQFETLKELCLNLMDIFDLEVEDIKGHSELDDKKTCPNFNMNEVRDSLRK